MSFKEIEDTLLGFDPKEAMKLIDQLPENQYYFKIVFKAEALRIEGEHEDSIKLCDSIISNQSEEEFPELIIFIAKSIKAYVLYRTNEFVECDQLISDAEWTYHSLSKKDKDENYIWYATLIQVKGNILTEKGSIIDAIQSWESAISLYENHNRTGRISGLLSNLGIQYSTLGQIEKGLEYLNRADEIYRKGSQRSIIYNYFNKLQLGRTYSLKGDYPKAMKYLEESLKIARDLNNQFYQFYSLVTIFYTYMRLENREAAKSYLDLITDLVNKIDNKHNRLLTNYMIATYLHSSRRVKNVAGAQVLVEKIVYEDQISIGLSNSATILLVEILLEELRSYGEEEVLNEIIHLTAILEKNANTQHTIVLNIQTMLLQSKLSLIKGDLIKSNKLLDKGVELAKKFQLDQFVLQIQDEKNKLRSDLFKWEEMIGRGAAIKEKMDLINYQEYIEIAKKYVESI